MLKENRKSGKILHVFVLTAFLDPYCEFMENNFSDYQDRHIFFVLGSGVIYKVPQGPNIWLAREMNPFYRYLWLFWKAISAKKIILHGIWDYKSFGFISLFPWLLKKTYWVVWGGDLYRYLSKRTRVYGYLVEKLRKFSIKKIGHLVTYIEGDYLLAKQWYGAQGAWHECIMYPSNLYRSQPSYVDFDQNRPYLNVLVGNSADPSNNQIEILQKLAALADKRLKIYCPLSYGDSAHAELVADFGRSLFGKNFTPMLSFMSGDEYSTFLSNIDIAIFNHRRQQAMGNTIALLGMGKKVYMRSDVTQSELFVRLGVKVFDVSSIVLEPIADEISKSNSKIIARYFSEENLRQQWSFIYEN